MNAPKNIIAEIDHLNHTVKKYNSEIAMQNLKLLRIEEDIRELRNTFEKLIEAINTADV